MGKLGFYFDLDNCIGCRACQMACKDRNDLPVGVLYRHIIGYETGSYPTPGLYEYSYTCNHCESPECVANCPTGAMFVADDGTVQHNDEECIGCKTCMNSCPYQVPQYSEEKSIVGKCDSCASIRANGNNPVCVDACNMRVIEFGDLDELRATHEGEELVDELPILPSASKTNPSILIKPRACALEKDYREVTV